MTIIRCDRSRANREIVRHDHDREPEIGDEATQQIEHARLDRDVEAAGRLVHEDKARMGHEIAGDLQALAHAARKRGRLVVDAVLVDLDAAEPVGRCVADAAVMPLADRHQPLADVRAGRDAHAQPVDRVLVDEAPVGAHQEAPLGLAEIGEIA